MLTNVSSGPKGTGGLFRMAVNAQNGRQTRNNAENRSDFEITFGTSICFARCTSRWA